jgi:hypothetical protein
LIKREGRERKKRESGGRERWGESVISKLITEVIENNQMVIGLQL